MAFTGEPVTRCNFAGNLAQRCRRRSPAFTPSSLTLSFNSRSQTSASESLGARQSPRGESEPPEPTFGPFGMQERLNWLILKKRKRNTSSHFLIVGRSYSVHLSGAMSFGQPPRFLSLHA